jgi:hypothetical protein
MRLTRSICCAMVIAGAACSNGLTAPPSGLPVTLSIVTRPDSPVPSIIGAGDSVTAVIMASGVSGCGQVPTVAAGLRGDDLIVTLSESVNNRPCPLSLVANLPAKIVVHDVPVGTRSARVVLRLLSGGQATYTELASGSITLP